MKVRITDKNDPLCGQEFDGHLVYYDYFHGKNEMFNNKVQDLYVVEINGENKYYLTHQIDDEYYDKQCIELECQKLGVKIGDEVRIIEPNSGYYPTDANYMTSVHVVTDVDRAGHVRFDNTNYYLYRPKLEVVKK